MSRVPSKPFPMVVFMCMLTLPAVSVAAFAQNPNDSPAPDQSSPAPDQPPPTQASPPTPGWRRFSQSSPRPAVENSKPAMAQNPNSTQPNSPDPELRNDPASNPPDEEMPSRLTLKPGTFVTVRVDQFLSSDRNHAGDGFSATLTRPLVVDGIVVAERGQTVGGRVVEAQKAGRVKGVSRLAVQLTELTLVDGHQVPIQTLLADETGPTSKARDAVAIGSTTATGAGIGAAVASSAGTGAAIGAGAGALAGTLGVLLTRGRPTVIYPESVLTFRLSAAVSFSTDRAPQAFHYVDTSQYERPAEQEEGPPPRRYACGGYGCPPPPPYYYGYYAPYYPSYWGPSFSFWFGRGFHHRRYYGRGFYGRGYYGRGYGHRH